MKPYERELEDWVCENLGAVVDGAPPTMVGRQVRLPNGKIMDVLAVSYEEYYTPKGYGSVFNIIPIEVKRDRVGARALVQLLGYMATIGVCAPEIVHRFIESTPNYAPIDRVRVSGILVGQYMDDDVRMALTGLDNVLFAQLDPESGTVWLDYGESSPRITPKSRSFVDEVSAAVRSARTLEYADKYATV